ncbi:serine/threonine protein phosphatase, partial [Streptomyces sp. NPDC058989]
MTEHPTSHESRRSASTAAPSASPARGPGGTAPLGAVPDPRSALQQPAATGVSPVPGSGFAVRGGDDLGLSGAAVTASAGPPAGRAGNFGHADDEPVADHGAARDGAAIPYGEAYGDSYGEVAMPASGREGGAPDAGRETARAGRRMPGAVNRAGAPESGEEPHHGQRPR